MKANLEIERKFIIDRIPEKYKSLKGHNINQGYICYNDKSEVRCRQIDNLYFLTIKGKGNLTRKENEIELSEQQFLLMWDTTTDARVFKERFIINYDKYLIELDVFKKNLEGLIIAEVEFNSTKAGKEFNKPKWFGDDVTFDERYKNKNLALDGIPID